MFRVEVIIIDESVPEVASDRPEVTSARAVSAYEKKEAAEQLATRMVDYGKQSIKFFERSKQLNSVT